MLITKKITAAFVLASLFTSLSFAQDRPAIYSVGQLQGSYSALSAHVVVRSLNEEALNDASGIVLLTGGQIKALSDKQLAQLQSAYQAGWVFIVTDATAKTDQHHPSGNPERPALCRT